MAADPLPCVQSRQSCESAFRKAWVEFALSVPFNCEETRRAFFVPHCVLAASHPSRISIALNTQPRGRNRSGEESGRVSAELKIVRSSTNCTTMNATRWPCRFSHRTGASCWARQPYNGLYSVDWIEKRQVGVEAIHRRNGIAGQADANIAPTAL